MTKISMLIPCYNEEENVIPLSEEIEKQFQINNATKDSINIE